MAGYVVWSKKADDETLVDILQTKRPSPRFAGHGTMRTRRYGPDDESWCWEMKRQSLRRYWKSNLCGYPGRATVSLRRYGTMDVKVELEEFSEGGDWLPSDDSWFWDSRKTEVVDGDTDNIDALTRSQIDVSDAEEGGALGGEVDLERKRQVEWNNRRPRFGMCPAHWRRRRHGTGYDRVCSESWEWHPSRRPPGSALLLQQ